MIKVGRPPLSVGTFGKIRFQRVPAAGPLVAWRARTQVRDQDGRTRPVERSARSKGAAEARLKEHLRDRVWVDTSDQLTPVTTVERLAEFWFAEGEWADTTTEQYRRTLDVHVIPGLGGLPISALTVSRCDAFLKRLASQHGASSAKQARSILSGMATAACRHDALAHNPLREVKPTAIPTKPVEAYTLAEARQIRSLITYHPKSIRLDLPELVDFMFATSLRLGEVIAFEWQDVDLDAGTCTVKANVHRLKGKGLVRNVYPNNKLKWRTLALPTWAVELLRARRERMDVTEGLIFPIALTGTLRDPSNTGKELRAAFEFMGIEGGRSHLFRKTGATLMDDSGKTPRMVADHLGHNQVTMGQTRYIKRDATKSGAAEVLEALAV